MLMDALAR